MLDLNYKFTTLCRGYGERDALWEPGPLMQAPVWSLAQTEGRQNGLGGIPGFIPASQRLPKNSSPGFHKVEEAGV